MKEIKITEIEGFRLGNAQNKEGATGCTVILCPDGASAGVDVRGGGPATREVALLNPVNMVEKIHAVMLSGGSAYGLDAGSGAMAYLEEAGKGFDVGVGIVPIVCGASLFDLVVGDPKCRPDKAMGFEACKNSEQGLDLAQGNFGAGTGASVGKYLGADYLMKSGLGTYAVQYGDLQIGAVVAVNALGDVFDVDTGKQLAGMLTEDKKGLRKTTEVMYGEYDTGRNVFSGNTTIGCIVTNAILTKAQANKIASMSHNGFARAINPIHTSADGDSIFVMASCKANANPDVLGTLAAEVMAKAINNAVLNTEAEYGLKCAKNFL